MGTFPGFDAFNVYNHICNQKWLYAEIPDFAIVPRVVEADVRVGGEGRNDIPMLN